MSIETLAKQLLEQPTGEQLLMLLASKLEAGDAHEVRASLENILAPIHAKRQAQAALEASHTTLREALTSEELINPQSYEAMVEPLQDLIDYAEDLLARIKVVLT
jgi:hypothetical protein